MKFKKSTESNGTKEFGKFLHTGNRVRSKCVVDEQIYF